MMVVDVLMTSCQVSLNPKIGPDTIQAPISVTATAKAAGRPTAREMDFAKRVKREVVWIVPSAGSAPERYGRSRLPWDARAPAGRGEPSPPSRAGFERFLRSDVTAPARVQRAWAGHGGGHGAGRRGRRGEREVRSVELR